MGCRVRLRPPCKSQTPVRIAAEPNKHIRFMLLKPLQDGCKRNSGSWHERISVNAHRYTAERDGAATVLSRLHKAVSIAVRQNLRLVELAFVPYWPDCMDYMFRGQTESRRFYCLSRLAGAAEIVEIPVKFWACGSVRARLCNRADRLAQAFDNKTHFILISPVGSPTSLNSEGWKSEKRPFAAENSKTAGPVELLCRISTS